MTANQSQAVVVERLERELRRVCAAHRTAMVNETAAARVNYLDGVADGVAAAISIIDGGAAASHRVEAMLDVQAEAAEGLAGVAYVRAILGRRRD